jgi:hypothetical protein
MHMRRICLSNLAGSKSVLCLLSLEYNLMREPIEPAAGADKTSSTKSGGYLLSVSGTLSRCPSIKENKLVAVGFGSIDAYEDPVDIREEEGKLFSELKVPAHLGPIPRAILIGSRKGLPHTLHRAIIDSPFQKISACYRNAKAPAKLPGLCVEI